MDWAERCVAQHESQLTYGRDFVDLDDDLLLLKTVKLSHPGGELKVSLSSPDARKVGFEWRAEFTLIDQAGNLRHYLLREEPEIVETYGRKVIPVELEHAQELAAELGAIKL